MLEIEAKGKVRILKINNGKDNRFNQDFIDALNGALDEIEADKIERTRDNAPHDISNCCMLRADCCIYSGLFLGVGFGWP